MNRSAAYDTSSKKDAVKRIAADADRRRNGPNNGNDANRAALFAGAEEEQKDNRSSEEVLDSTIRAASEAVDSGNSTMRQLDAQNKQLDKIDQNLDGVNATLTHSERILRGMKSLGGAIANVFTKAPKPQSTRYEEPDKNGKKRKPASAATSSSSSSNSNSSSSSTSSSSGSSSKSSKQSAAANRAALMAGAADGSSSKASNDTNPFAQTGGDGTVAQQKARQDEKMDEQLDTILGLVATMKTQAGDMGAELEAQNKKIDHIDDVVTQTNQRIRKDNRTITQID